MPRYILCQFHYCIYSGMIMLYLLVILLPCIVNAHDLVKVKDSIANIAVDLRYATKNNFTNSQLYPSGAQAYLVKKAVHALMAAQQTFNKHGIGLKIWDAYRPFSVQKKLWQHMPNKTFVADPAKGSNHNRGTAVDVTLIDLITGKELDMPTGFDDFTVHAKTDALEAEPNAQKNRELLKRVMRKHGWQIIPSEWWHFNYSEWQKYPVLNVQFAEL